MGKGRRTWLLLVLAAVTACGAVMAAPRVAAGSGTGATRRGRGEGGSRRLRNPGADLGAGRRLPADLR